MNQSDDYRSLCRSYLQYCNDHDFDGAGRTGLAPWKPLTGMSGPRQPSIEFDVER